MRILILTVVATLLFPAMQPHAEAPIRLVALGDSLTAGYRLAPSDAFPAKLEKALKSRGWNVSVANAGVSGDTSKAGLARFDWAVPKNTDAVIVELGANDALRGVDPAQTKANLDAILSRLKDRNTPALLAGFPTPTGYGPDYARSFADLFPALAKKYDAIHYPSFLEGVALKPDLNQSDGLHPTAKGIDVIVTNILPAVEQLLTKVKTRQAAN